MQYLGGKSRIAKPITEIILRAAEGRTTYVEPFLGGASVMVRANPHFMRVIGTDAHPDLIALWQAVIDGWVPPTSLSEEQYQALRREPDPSALRGFAGFGCSFGGQWFGGYARNADGRNYADVSSRGIVRKAAQMRGVEVLCRRFEDVAVTSECVVYADPPYANTKGYSVDFDSAAFWRTAAAWADTGAAVLVSEYAAPEGWVPVWAGNPQASLIRTSNSRQANEVLYADPRTSSIFIRDDKEQVA